MTWKTLDGTGRRVVIILYGWRVCQCFSVFRPSHRENHKHRMGKPDEDSTGFAAKGQARPTLMPMNRWREVFWLFAICSSLQDRGRRGAAGASGPAAPGQGTLPGPVRLFSGRPRGRTCPGPSPARCTGSPPEWCWAACRSRCRAGSRPPRWSWADRRCPPCTQRRW